MNSQDIQLLLARRYPTEKFVLVTECKDGPTMASTNHQRMDAWAMARSWAHPLTVAIEIKVSRSDFLQDAKWRTYLDYCNEFYFAVAPGVCSLDELPPGVGLLEASRNAKLLVCRRRAVYREIPPGDLDSVFRYILMSRARITGVDIPHNAQQRGPHYWREWLEERADERDTGHALSQAVARRTQARCAKVEEENSRLIVENARLANVKRMLEEAGIIAPDGTLKYDWPHDLQQHIKRVMGHLDGPLVEKIREAHRGLSHLIRELNTENTQLSPTQPHLSPPTTTPNDFP